MDEGEFARRVAAVERHPVFAKIRPCLRRFGFPQRTFYLPAPGEEAIESNAIAWSEHSYELGLIRRIGREAFERYFLLEDEARSLPEVAVACGLDCAQAQAIQAFVLTSALQQPSPRKASRMQAAVTCLAKVAVEQGRPMLLWTLPHLARGRYRIDYEALAKLRASLPSARERREARRLVGIIEAINLRQGALWRCMEIILAEQSAFFRNARRSSLAPLPPSELAQRLSVHPSTIGRLAYRRGVLCPWDEPMSLRELMPNRRQCAVYVLRDILASAGAGTTDGELQRRLKNEFGLVLSRRTVNECRHAAMTSA